MIMVRSSALTFTANRGKPELITPEKATPFEVKALSDIDDQESLRYHVSFVQIYGPRGADKEDMNPVKMIREALSKALVYYYPWAGRLREVGVGRKLVVECTGEGVMFVGAEADVTVEDLTPHLHDSLPCFKELLFDHVAFPCHILDSPLLFIQVTRMKCGGFVLATRINHTMTDGLGLLMLLNATAELARGASHLSVTPVWERHILCSRNPPRVAFPHREYGDNNLVRDDYFNDEIVHRCFFFGSSQIAALRQCLHPHFEKCSTFELVAAFLWRCRVNALRVDPRQEVRLVCLVGTRFKFKTPVHGGYYGNTIAFPAAISTAEKISSNRLEYALSLVKETKAEGTEEYIRSVADLRAVQRRPHPTMLVGMAWAVADNTRIAYDKIDFGWGKPVYGGPAAGLIRDGYDQVSFFIKTWNYKGETGVLVPICLPAIAMERFAREVKANTTAQPSAKL